MSTSLRLLAIQRFHDDEPDVNERVHALAIYRLVTGLLLQALPDIMSRADVFTCCLLILGFEFDCAYEMFKFTPQLIRCVI